MMLASKPLTIESTVHKARAQSHPYPAWIAFETEHGHARGSFVHEGPREPRRHARGATARERSVDSSGGPRPIGQVRPTPCTPHSPKRVNLRSRGDSRHSHSSLLSNLEGRAHRVRGVHAGLSNARWADRE